MSFFVYDSTKHAWVYKTYIYIYIYTVYIYKDAPDINMLTNAFFFFWLFVFYWIRYLHHRWWILMTFFKLFSSESAVPTSDVQLHWYSMVKQDPWLLIVFFSSWIHGNKRKHLNNTQISGMIYLFHLLNRICCRNDSKSVHISVVRSVCTIMCLWPSLCMFWLYCLVNKIQIIKK